MPDKYELRQNYPNPFNPTTNIEFFVPSLSHITLTLYNMKGEKIEDLVGNTPILELDMEIEKASNFLIKMEGCNPTGAIKDRIALFMIKQKAKLNLYHV